MLKENIYVDKMNSQQPSFSVKSSHKILNNETEVSLPEENLNIDQNTDQSAEKNVQQSKSKSNTGMVIHTTNTSVEDFY